MSSIRRYLAILCAGAAGLFPARGAAQNPALAMDVRWEPAEPHQGSFIYVVGRATGDGDRGELSVEGSLAGQPLHFEVDRFGEYRAIGAVPVNALATIPLQLSVTRRGETGHRIVRVPVAAGEFEMERLRVAPRFTARPDSALAERIRAERVRAARVSNETHERSRLWSEEFVRPRPSRITSSFGTGRMFNGELRSRHWGVDFDGDQGDPIRAANRGIVALVGEFYYAGNVVYIDHGAGLVTVYMHMSEVEVQEGQLVERGEVIGKVGATGRVTGPHLHWTARYSRISVDGLSLFELDTAPLGPPIDVEAPDGSR